MTRCQAVLTFIQCPLTTAAFMLGASYLCVQVEVQVPTLPAPCFVVPQLVCQCTTKYYCCNCLGCCCCCCCCRGCRGCCFPLMTNKNQQHAKGGRWESNMQIRFLFYTIILSHCFVERTLKHSVKKNIWMKYENRSAVQLEELANQLFVLCSPATWL